jgi:hypothetical protein
VAWHAETAVLVRLAHPHCPWLIARRIACYSKKGGYEMNPKEIATQQILLMSHVENICEKQDLVPPVEVNVVDAGGNQYDLNIGRRTMKWICRPCPSCCPSSSLSMMRRAPGSSGDYSTLHHRQNGKNASCNKPEGKMRKRKRSLGIKNDQRRFHWISENS